MPPAPIQNTANTAMHVTNMAHQAGHVTGEPCLQLATQGQLTPKAVTARLPEARARAPYSAPCTLPCSCSAALHDLMLEMVGKLMLPAEQMQRTYLLHGQISRICDWLRSTRFGDDKCSRSTGEGRGMGAPPLPAAEQPPQQHTAGTSCNARGTSKRGTRTGQQMRTQGAEGDAQESDPLVPRQRQQQLLP